MPPGWFPDPYYPGSVRWWDGYAWTAHAALAPAQGAAVRSGSELRADLERQRRLEPRVRAAVVVGWAIQSAVVLLAALTFGHYLHQIVHFLRALNRWSDDGGVGPEPKPPSQPGLDWLADLAELALLGVGLVFMLWLRRAAQLARGLGLPAVRAPYWAILGFFVPVVSLWFPYQVARDVFPPGHPGRRLVARWWTLWLTALFLTLPLYPLAYFSTVAAVGWAVLSAAVGLWAALTARQFVSAAGQTQADGLERADRLTSW